MSNSESEKNIIVENSENETEISDVVDVEITSNTQSRKIKNNVLIVIISVIAVVAIIISISLSIILFGKKNDADKPIDDNVITNDITIADADKIVTDDNSEDSNKKPDDINNKLDTPLVYDYEYVLSSLNKFLLSNNLHGCEIKHSRKPGKNPGEYYWIATVCDSIVYLIYERNGEIVHVYLTHVLYNSNYGYLYKTTEQLSSAISFIIKAALCFLPEEQQSLLTYKMSENLYYDNTNITGVASDGEWTFTHNQNSYMVTISLEKNSSVSINNGSSDTLDSIINDSGVKDTVGTDSVIQDSKNPNAHVHSYVEQKGKSATCTENGYLTYYECECGYSNFCEIPPLGHNYAFVDSKEATCTEDGYKEYKCTACSDFYREYATAIGHNYVDATCTTPKTCKTCGNTIGNVLPHNMFHTRCRNCDYVDFSGYTLVSDTFQSSSWYYTGGANTVYLDDGEASIIIDSNGKCKVVFADYSYTFTLVQSGYEGAYDKLIFDCYQNGKKIENTTVSFYFSQNRCDFFSYRGAIGFSQVVLNFDM